MEDFFELYFKYIGKTESPRVFHRWTAISIIGALLGRNVRIDLGHYEIYPNQYILLMGSPGARKSSAIGIGKKIIKTAGYENFSADRTSKEALWQDMTTMQMKGHEDEDGLEELILDKPVELFIVADEFNDFMGTKNEEFATALSKMWDCPDFYQTSTKRSDNAFITKPTINILGGNTPGNIAKAFGPEAINSGFFSRIVFVHGTAIVDEADLITFPEPPDSKLRKDVIVRLEDIHISLMGSFKLGTNVKTILDRVYKKFPGIDDYRFNYYQTRRFIHLLKLIQVLAAARLTMEVTEEDCIRANTLLHLAELYMPHSLGEFGKAKNSDVANTVMEVLKSSRHPLTVANLWKKVSQDLNKIQELVEIIRGMQQAGRIQQINTKGKIFFLPNIDVKNKWEDGLIDYTLVTPDEHPSTTQRMGKEKGDAS